MSKYSSVSAESAAENGLIRYVGRKHAPSPDALVLTGHEYELVKQPVRDKVLEFFSSHIDQADDSSTKRILSLPGQYWYFESELCRLFPSVNIVGFERVFKLWQRFASNMPADDKDKYIPSKKKIARAKILQTSWVPSFLVKTHASDRRVCIASTRRAKLLHFDLYDYLANVIVSDEKHLIAGAWLDGYSPVGSSRFLAAIRNIPRWCRKDMSVPVAITFVCGRDEPGMSSVFRQLDRDAVLGRVRFIEAVLNNVAACEFELVSHISYRSSRKNSSLRMGVLLGLIRIAQTFE